VLTSAAAMLGVDQAEFDKLALAAEPGSGGLTLLPYLDGERTPNLPSATGSLFGLKRSNMTPENLARAAVEGMLCGLAAGLDAVRRHGIEVRRVLLIGGGAQSAAVRAVAPAVFGVPVHLPEIAEHVAIGAARQAAWALLSSQSTSSSEPPTWQGKTRLELTEPTEAELAEGRQIQQRHLIARELEHGIPAV
jgi:xylulokinase